MPRMLAIEWDQREARFVIGRTQGRSLEVEAAVRVPLPPPDDAEPRQGPNPSLVELLKAALELYGARRLRALCGVQRAQLDLRQLTLPPGPSEELPELVRHQAVRELTTMSEGALLDFVPLESQGDESRPVMAAALSSEQAAVIQSTCDQLGLKAVRMYARPYATMSLFFRRHAAPVASDEHEGNTGRPACLLVDAEADEADLTVLCGKDLVYSRTARLATPADDEDPLAPLVAEIRRTVVAVSNQPTQEDIEVIYVCGAAEEQLPLVAKIAAETGLRVEVFDPFAGLTLSSELARHLPSERGRFTSALGMLCDDADSVAPTLDFLHPRRAAVPKDRRKQAMIVGGAIAAAAVLITAGFAWRTLSGLDAEVRRLARQSKELDGGVKRAEEMQTAVEAIGGWQIGEVIWLDELRDLSLRFPKRRDAVLLRLSMGRGPSGVGAIELQGLVRDPTIVGKMESTLRDEFHEVRSKRVQQNVRAQRFNWQFESSLAVLPRDREEYREAANPAREVTPEPSGDEAPNSTSPAGGAAGPPAAPAAAEPTATNSAGGGR